MADTDSAPPSGKMKRMLGISLDGWNSFMVVFLAIAAFAATAVGVSQGIIIKLQRVAEAEGKLEFDKYKLSVEGQVADAKREGIAAGEKAANAMLRAAELEKEAANARLESEKIKAAVAWRTVGPELAAALNKVLASKPGAVNLRYTDGDPEALFVAAQLSQILTKANWQVAPGALKLGNSLVFGFALPDANSTDGKTLREAFAAAHIPFSTTLPATGMMLGSSIYEIPGAPMLMVGSRQPPSLP